jgi:hypothetical protein
MFERAKDGELFLRGTSQQQKHCAESWWFDTVKRHWAKPTEREAGGYKQRVIKARPPHRKPVAWVGP